MLFGMIGDTTRNGTALVVGLDSSTTATKAIAWNRDGEAVASAREAISLSSPEPGYYEQDPGDWWGAACRALGAVAAQVDPKRIAALSVSNQRETFVPLDRGGGCIRPAIVWLDERCRDEVERFAGKIGRRKIHRITGKPVDYAPVVYRLAWMRRHEAKSFEKIGMICDVNTFLVWKLTGSFKTSAASADPLGIFDIRKRQWSATVLAALGLNRDQLPRTYSPGEILGTVNEEAARMTGLRPGTLVVAGGGDGQAAGLGVNALESGRAYLNLGTAVVAGVYSSRYRAHRAFRTLLSCTDSGYYYECSLRAGTFAVDWFIKKVLSLDPAAQPDIYERLEAEAGGVAPGSGGLFHLPYLCGVMNPYWDTAARGAFVGLSASHTRGHMYRALLEGIGFELAFGLSLVENVVRRTVRELLLIGGGASSGIWCRLVADITGKPVVIPRTAEASCLGAGIAAACGAGWYGGFREAAGRMTGTRHVIKPDADRCREYRRLSGVYKQIYPNLRNIGDGKRRPSS